MNIENLIKAAINLGFWQGVLETFGDAFAFDDAVEQADRAEATYKQLKSDFDAEAKDHKSEAESETLNNLQEGNHQ